MPAYAFRNCFEKFLAGFDDAPQSIAELIEFNNDHANEEFTSRKLSALTSLRPLLIIPGNDNQWFLETARDATTTKEVFDRNFNALRAFVSTIMKSLFEKYDIDVVLGPCDSRTGSV